MGMIFATTAILNRTIKPTSFYASTHWPLDNLDSEFTSAQGFFGVQFQMGSTGGTGTCRLDAEVSNDGTNFFVPVGSSAIHTGMASSSGTSGGYFLSFSPPIAKYLRLKVTELSTAGSTNAGVLIESAILAIR